MKTNEILCLLRRGPLVQRHAPHVTARHSGFRLSTSEAHALILLRPVRAAIATIRERSVTLLEKRSCQLLAVNDHGKTWKFEHRPSLISSTRYSSPKPGTVSQ